MEHNATIKQYHHGNGRKAEGEEAHRVGGIGPRCSKRMELTEQKEKALTERMKSTQSEWRYRSQSGREWHSPKIKERERGSQSCRDKAQTKCSQSRIKRAQLKETTKAKTPNAR